MERGAGDTGMGLSMPECALLLPLLPNVRKGRQN